MTHLSTRELIAWRDHPTPELRSRVMPHLAACAACAATYAGIVRDEPVTDAPRVFAASDFVQAGYAVRSPQTRVSSGGLAIAGLMAAAAIFLALVVTLPPSGDRNVERGVAAIAAVAPAGRVTDVTEFRWTGAGDEAVRVDVSDANGQLVFTATVRGDRLGVAPDVAARFVAGTAYEWHVTRLDARGDSVESSALVVFTITGR